MSETVSSTSETSIINASTHSVNEGHVQTCVRWSSLQRRCGICDNCIAYAKLSGDPKWIVGLSPQEQNDILITLLHFSSATMLEQLALILSPMLTREIFYHREHSYTTHIVGQKFTNTITQPLRSGTFAPASFDKKQSFDRNLNNNTSSMPPIRRSHSSSSMINLKPRHSRHAHPISNTKSTQRRFSLSSPSPSSSLTIQTGLTATRASLSDASESYGSSKRLHHAFLNHANQIRNISLGKKGLPAKQEKTADHSPSIFGRRNSHCQPPHTLLTTQPARVAHIQRRLKLMNIEPRWRSISVAGQKRIRECVLKLSRWYASPTTNDSTRMVAWRILLSQFSTPTLEFLAMNVVELCGTLNLMRLNRSSGRVLRVASNSNFDLVTSLPRHLAQKVFCYLTHAELEIAAQVDFNWARIAHLVHEHKAFAQDAQDVLQTVDSQCTAIAETHPTMVEVPYPLLSDETSSITLASQNIFCGPFACIRLPDTPRTSQHLCIASAAYGIRFLTGGTGRDVFIRELPSGKEIGRLRGHAGGVLAAAHLVSRCWFATASSDTSIRLWNDSTYRIEGSLHGHIKPVSFLCWDDVSQVLVSACMGQRIICWDVSKQRPIASQRVKGRSDDVGCSITSLSLYEITCAVGLSTGAVWLYVLCNQQFSCNLRIRMSPPVLSHTATFADSVFSNSQQKFYQLSNQSSGSSINTTPADAHFLRSSEANTPTVKIKARKKTIRESMDRVSSKHDDTSVMEQSKEAATWVEAVTLTSYFIAVGTMDGRALVFAREGLNSNSEPYLCWNHSQRVTCLRLLYLRLLTGSTDGLIRIFSLVSRSCIRVFRVLGIGSPIRSFDFASLRSIVVSTDDALALLDFGSEADPNAHTRHATDLHRTEKSRHVTLGADTPYCATSALQDDINDETVLHSEDEELTEAAERMTIFPESQPDKISPTDNDMYEDSQQEHHKQKEANSREFTSQQRDSCVYTHCTEKSQTDRNDSNTQLQYDYTQEDECSQPAENHSTMTNNRHQHSVFPSCEIMKETSIPVQSASSGHIDAFLESVGEISKLTDRPLGPSLIHLFKSNSNKSSSTSDLLNVKKTNSTSSLPIDDELFNQNQIKLRRNSYGTNVFTVSNRKGSSGSTGMFRTMSSQNGSSTSLMSIFFEDETQQHNSSMAIPHSLKERQVRRSNNRVSLSEDGIQAGSSSGTKLDRIYQMTVSGPPHSSSFSTSTQVSPSRRLSASHTVHSTPEKKSNETISAPLGLNLAHETPNRISRQRSRSALGNEDKFIKTELVGGLLADASRSGYSVPTPPPNTHTPYKTRPSNFGRTFAGEWRRYFKQSPSQRE